MKQAEQLRECRHGQHEPHRGRIDDADGGGYVVGGDGVGISVDVGSVDDVADVVDGGEYVVGGDGVDGVGISVDVGSVDVVADGADGGGYVVGGDGVDDVGISVDIGSVSGVHVSVMFGGVHTI